MEGSCPAAPGLPSALHAYSAGGLELAKQERVRLQPTTKVESMGFITGTSGQSGEDRTDISKGGERAILSLLLAQAHGVTVLPDFYHTSATNGTMTHPPPTMLERGREGERRKKVEGPLFLLSYIPYTPVRGGAIARGLRVQVLESDGQKSDPSNRMC